MKRDLKKELNRKKIIDAAYQLMIKNGIQKTSVKEVSELSGISFVTMYKYFKSKEELAEEVALQFFKENSQELQAIAEDETLDFLLKFKKFELRSKQLRLTLTPEVNEEFMRAFSESKAVQTYAKEWNDRFWQLMIKSGRKSGVINSDVSDEAISLFANMFTEYVSTHISDPKLIPQFEKLFMYGLSGNQSNR
ncbi:TetR/AcrR family transcriptional regulator [Enterococcus xiangfangensis]|uniref:TetR/AcrR family transcriptional regulator n=1 Tax=Enterococcus xiangfangensis TaxID=1296537 RepID=A0ABU3F686_9ENTE|nr:TetR/AcrR family transcriptional regulator [Enterococcus xiangfangensis]MBM7712809.1 AcrR family transcriptional regulator [Enterococcus xiangfangensis]MDT2758171.1 TetR/AcrR family transcriptional regulator [Enterococcus xiangfangensis]NBK09157.1 TetR/AcrR family transcriptional regulator [Enterococcus asini]